jgi:hypothetical protein
MYGSAAAGRKRQDNDMDIVVFFDNPFDMNAHFVFWSKMMIAFHCGMDVGAE